MIPRYRLPQVVLATVRDARRLHGIGLVEIAVAAGVSPPYVPRVLNGHSPPSEPVARALVDLLPSIPADVSDALLGVPAARDAQRPGATVADALSAHPTTNGEPMTPDELANLDPATLTGQQRGHLRALAMTARNMDTRTLAGSILANAKATPKPEAYRRGADRAADYGTGPGADHINR